MKTADELVELALPSVLDGLKQELTRTIDWQVKERAAKLVGDHVETWIKENILPEITSILIESKEGLIQLGAKVGPALVEEMTAALLAQFKKNLEQSWDREKIFSAMFK